MSEPDLRYKACEILDSDLASRAREWLDKAREKQEAFEQNVWLASLQAAFIDAPESRLESRLASKEELFVAGFTERISEPQTSSTTEQATANSLETNEHAKTGAKTLVIKIAKTLLTLSSNSFANDDPRHESWKKYANSLVDDFIGVVADGRLTATRKEEFYPVLFDKAAERTLEGVPSLWNASEYGAHLQTLRSVLVDDMLGYPFRRKSKAPPPIRPFRPSSIWLPTTKPVTAAPASPSKPGEELHKVGDGTTDVAFPIPAPLRESREDHPCGERLVWLGSESQFKVWVSQAGTGLETETRVVMEHFVFGSATRSTDTNLNKMEWHDRLRYLGDWILKAKNNIEASSTTDLFKRAAEHFARNGRPISGKSLQENLRNRTNEETP
jgi:hypothetical protein